MQYGYRVKSHSVYLSQFQFLPYARTQSYFEEKMTIPISTGSIFNFNKEAYLLLDQFDEEAKTKLLAERVLNADEAGININKKTNTCGGTVLLLVTAKGDLTAVQWLLEEGLASIDETNNKRNTVFDYLAIGIENCDSANKENYIKLCDYLTAFRENQRKLYDTAKTNIGFR